MIRVCGRDIRTAQVINIGTTDGRLSLVQFLVPSCSAFLLAAGKYRTKI